MNGYSERGRPAIWGPVLIAAIFLGVIGGSVGWIAGARDNAAAQQRDGSGEPATDDGADGSGQQDGSGPQGGSAPDGGTDYRGDRCPQPTVDRAGVGALGVELFLRTSQSLVWICVDDDGTLFYQGFVGEPGERMEEGNNALFLTDVQPVEDGVYRATNGSGDQATTYTVSRERLVIEHAGGDPQVEPAAD